MIFKNDELFSYVQNLSSKIFVLKGKYEKEKIVLNNRGSVEKIL